jgi:hypothetical protein
LPLAAQSLPEATGHLAGAEHGGVGAEFLTDELQGVLQCRRAIGFDFHH